MAERARNERGPAADKAPTKQTKAKGDLFVKRGEGDLVLFHGGDIIPADLAELPTVGAVHDGQAWVPAS